MKFPGDKFSSDLGPDGRSQLQAYTYIFEDKFQKDALDAGSCACDSDGENANESVLNQAAQWQANRRSEEHTSELQSPCNLVCRLLLEKKKTQRRLPGTSRCRLRRQA